MVVTSHPGLPPEELAPCDQIATVRSGAWIVNRVCPCTQWRIAAIIAARAGLIMSVPKVISPPAVGLALSPIRQPLWGW
jgi:hypothetical protein